MTTTITGPCRIALHDLHVRADGTDWIVGRADTGQFVAVPDIAARALHLLREGLTVEETRQRIRIEQARDIDIAGFVERLVDLGFVASIDDRQIPAVPVPRMSLPRLQPHHVRWLVTWPVAAVVLVLILAGALVLLGVPDTVPVYRDLLWSDHPSLVVVGNVMITWAIVLLHELAHLTTARAYGVPGRMSLGTRLQFLAAQTDVSGIWAAPRGARLVVYLSGLGVNVAVAAAGLIVRALAGPESGVDRIAAAVVILALLPVPLQLMVFMRTDVYFVLQDLARCRNLYADGSAYVRWWGRRFRQLVGSPPPPPDPSAGLPSQERRAVRAYAVLLALGTAACLFVAVTVTLPFAVALLATTVANLYGRAGVGMQVDALATVSTVAGYWVLWAWAWWQRHGRSFRTWLLRRTGHGQSRDSSVRR